MEKGSKTETGFFVWKVIPMCPEKNNKNENWGMVGKEIPYIYIYRHHQ
jgi:hypothetical protein